MACQVSDLLTSLSTAFETTLTSFPGNLPVSLERKMVEQIAFGYLFTLKADGLERIFIIVLEEGKVFIVNRQLQMTFIGEIKLQCFHDKWFLFDAELVHVDGDNKLLIFDTLIFRSLSVLQEEIATRYELAKFFLAHIVSDSRPEPLNALHEWSIHSSCEFHEVHMVPNWQIRVKPLWTHNHLAEVWANQKLAEYPVDGLIFVRRLCSYEPFRCNPDSLIKWKPVHTIDFVLLAFAPDLYPLNLDKTKELLCFRRTEGDALLCLPGPTKAPVWLSAIWTQSSTQSPMQSSTQSSMQSKSPPNSLLGKIVECAWKNDEWCIQRIRTDKDTANSQETVLRTLASILDHIELQDIIDIRV